MNALRVLRRANNNKSILIVFEASLSRASSAGFFYVTLP